MKNIKFSTLDFMGAQNAEFGVESVVDRMYNNFSRKLVVSESF